DARAYQAVTTLLGARGALADYGPRLPEAHRAAGRRRHALLRGAAEAQGGAVFETVGDARPAAARPPRRWPVARRPPHAAARVSSAVRRPRARRRRQRYGSHSPIGVPPRASSRTCFPPPPPPT